MKKIDMLIESCNQCPFSIGKSSQVHNLMNSNATFCSSAKMMIPEAETYQIANFCPLGDVNVIDVDFEEAKDDKSN